VVEASAGGEKAPSQGGTPGPAPDRLGLLCHEMMDANFLTAILSRVRPDLPVDVLYTREDLTAWVATVTPATRLVAFCSGVLVPGEVLGALGGPAYNFHPGSPEYPGRFPAALALYDGVTTFGATLHEMAVRVDSGPIVGGLRFVVPPGSDYRWLVAKAHQATLHLFLQVVPALARSSAPLARVPLSWGVRQCSQRALDRACCLPSDITAEDMERRCRSFAQIPGARLYVMLQGRRFDLTA